MALENNIIYLLLLLPGFLVYTLTYRLLGIEDKKDPFEATFLSLFLSILIGLALLFFNSIGWISFETINLSLGLILTSLIILFIILSLIFIKYLLPYIQKLTQKFDIIKWSGQDILSDVLRDHLDKNNGIWLAICTKEDRIYTGQLVREGIFNKKRGLYLKKIKDMKGKLPVEEYDGMFFTEDNINWISIINYNLSNSR